MKKVMCDPIDIDLMNESVTFYKLLVTNKNKSFLKDLKETMDFYGDNLEKMFKAYNFKINHCDELYRGEMGSCYFIEDLYNNEYLEFIEINHNVRTSFVKQFKDYLEKQNIKLSVFFQENDYRCDRFYTNDFFNIHFKPFCFCDGSEICDDISFLIDKFKDYNISDEELNEIDWDNVDEINTLAKKYDIDFQFYFYEWDEL